MKRNQNNEAFASATASTATINRATPNMPNTKATIIPLSQYHSQEDITLTSMEVAEMIGKEHANLLKDIRRYINGFEKYNSELCNDITSSGMALGGKVKINLAKFFKKSTYTDTQGKSRTCYYITKDGCDFIAHKLTGQKGIQFTVLYIQKFRELESYVNTNMVTMTMLNMMRTITEELASLKDTVNTIQYNYASTQPLLQTTIKPPTPRNTRWKSKTFKKLQQYIDYVNDKFHMSVKFNNAISSVLNKMDEDDCWDTDTWDNDAFKTSINAYSDKYKELFDLEEEPLILDVVEYFPELKKKFTDTLDNILEEYDLTSKCA